MNRQKSEPQIFPRFKYALQILKIYTISQISVFKITANDMDSLRNASKTWLASSMLFTQWIFNENCWLAKKKS